MNRNRKTTGLRLCLLASLALAGCRALPADKTTAMPLRAETAPVSVCPDGMRAMVRDTTPKWRELVRVAGLKPE